MKTLIYVLVCIGFILGVVFVYESIQNDKKKAEFIEKNYPFLDTFTDTSVSGIVFSIIQPMNRFSKGAFLVELKNADKFTLPAVTRNYSYNPYDICDFLQVNDSIYKPKGTDSIYIFRNNEKYYFVLNEILNIKNK